MIKCKIYILPFFSVFIVCYWHTPSPWLADVRWCLTIPLKFRYDMGIDLFEKRANPYIFVQWKSIVNASRSALSHRKRFMIWPRYRLCSKEMFLFLRWQEYSWGMNFLHLTRITWFLSLKSWRIENNVIYNIAQTNKRIQWSSDRVVRLRRALNFAFTWLNRTLRVTWLHLLLSSNLPFPQRMQQTRTWETTMARNHKVPTT